MMELSMQSTCLGRLMASGFMKAGWHVAGLPVMFTAFPVKRLPLLLLKTMATRSPAFIHSPPITPFNRTRQQNLKRNKHEILQAHRKINKFHNPFVFVVVILDVACLICTGAIRSLQAANI